VIYTLTLNATLDRVLRVPGFGGGGVLRAELVALLAAGKGFNVSRDLAELGAASVAAGLVGRNELPLYVESFRALGVEVLAAGFEAPTRSNVTVLDPGAGVEAHLRERGPALSGEKVAELEESLLPRLGVGDVLAACGSLPPGVSPERFAALLAAARERGAELMVDSSGAALAAACDVFPEILSVNAGELAELAGGEVETAVEARDAAGELAARGAGTVLAKLGAEGAVLVNGGRALRARSRPVEALNTVGAGDAFNAGFLARRDEGPEKALGFAAACGAAQAASAAIGRLERAEVERLAGAVEVVDI